MIGLLGSHDNAERFHRKQDFLAARPVQAIDIAEVFYRHFGNLADDVDAVGKQRGDGCVGYVECLDAIRASRRDDFVAQSLWQIVEDLLELFVFFYGLVEPAFVHPFSSFCFFSAGSLSWDCKPAVSALSLLPAGLRKGAVPPPGPDLPFPVPPEP